MSDADFVDEDLEGEPEVPEYLLSEKKQGRRGGRGRGGRGGRGGGYRSALERERYGVGSSSYSRGGRRGGGAGGRGGNQRSAPAMEPIEQTAGGDPWSEVPPEVQELLMAEMARRERSDADADADKAEAKPKRTTRRKSTTKAADDKADAAAEDESVEV